MKKNAAMKKLQLSRETIGALKNSQLTEVLGGTFQPDQQINLALTSNNTRYEPCCACA